jgi:hypothetical protein
MAYTTIDDPSAYFHTQLYTGNGADQSITNDANAGDFKPDWVWVKERSSTSGHGLFDSNRGIHKVIRSNSTEDEESQTNYLKSFDTDGFTMGNDGSVNQSSQTYVAWQWKANGGTTSSNSDGTITSTVQANTTAGFSIVTFTGTSTNVTTGHGLNQAPEIFFAKSRVSNSTNWNTYTSVIDGSLDYLFLNSTDAAGNASNSLPTSSVLYTNQTDSSVAYCFHSVKGYSKIGKYTGNGNADGTFVYTGFKPAWIMIHRTDSSGENWQMFDNKRDGFNNGSSSNKMLKANVSETEDSNSTGFLDLLSNGFKIRESAARHNASGGTYIYMAFAEHPFVSSKGVPVTAR